MQLTAHYAGIARCDLLRIAIRTHESKQMTCGNQAFLWETRTIRPFRGTRDCIYLEKCSNPSMLQATPIKTRPTKPERTGTPQV